MRRQLAKLLLSARAGRITGPLVGVLRALQRVESQSILGTCGLQLEGTATALRLCYINAYPLFIAPYHAANIIVDALHRRHINPAADSATTAL